MPVSKNPADVLSCCSDYVREAELLVFWPMLQEKLWNQTLEPLKSNCKPMELNQMIMAATKHMTDLHPELNPKALKECTLYINALMACTVQNVPTDENVATSVMRGNLGPLVSWLFINQVFESEMAYTHKLLKPLIDLLLHVQAWDAECTGIWSRIQGGPTSLKVKHLPWSISLNGLIRYNSCAYISNNAVVKDEILCMNHDDLTGGHFGNYRTCEVIAGKYY
ncbi:hypothetical protein FQN52_000055 [Onygenales sp. PD_12]|nr:hypothetical protein FQN52_000055 [Onygenales sp. PD_12]